jgi:hypothetical protein
MNIPPGYAQVNLIYGGAAVPRKGEVVFGVDLNTFVDDLEQVADDVIQAWEDSIRVVTSSNALLASVRIKAGPNATGQFIEVAAGNVGGAGATSIDPQVAALGTKITARGGRSGRGRMFLPFIDEEYTVSGGGYTPSGLTDIQAAMDGFRVLLAADGHEMVLLHNSEELTPDVVTSVQLQPLVATQRRRVRRVGGRRAPIL